MGSVVSDNPKVVIPRSMVLEIDSFSTPYVGKCNGAWNNCLAAKRCTLFHFPKHLLRVEKDTCLPDERKWSIAKRKFSWVFKSFKKEKMLIGSMSDTSTPLERNACSLLITWVLHLVYRSKRNIYLGASRIIKKVAIIIFCCGFHLRYNRIFLILQSENQQLVTSTTPTTQIGLGLLLNGIRELPVYSISILRKIP